MPGERVEINMKLIGKLRQNQPDDYNRTGDNMELRDKLNNEKYRIKRTISITTNN